MGILSRVVIGGALLATGYYIGHYMVPPKEVKYESVQKQGIEMIINTETKKEYVRSDLPSVIRYLSRQDPAKLEQALKGE